MANLAATLAVLAATGLLVYQELRLAGRQAHCGDLGEEKAWIQGCTAKLAQRYLSQSERAEALVHRGKAWSLIQDTKGALADFEEAALLDPNNSEARFAWDRSFRMVEPRWARCADRAAQKQDLVEACSLFIDGAGAGGKLSRREALKVRASAQIWLASDKSGSARERYQPVFADLDAALKISPEDADALRERAQVWERIGALDDAIRDYTYAIAFTPLPWRNSPLRARAMVYRMQGKPEDARADYEAALKIDPGDITAKAELQATANRAAPN
ncbi:MULTISPECIES: tetratricopeptide repeat protein [Rhodomicrobium]|uniref:tetratricopeptide repeat protein n=1 Tax=Rhodomicrobium TaxID=1068 RepID=UPI001481FB2C|nr:MULTISPECIES: tetratricopeptide repeat protein [Rhodomicrobium]